jgi:hypothetical protein
LPTPLEESEESTRPRSPLRNTNSSHRGTANGDKELPPIDGSALSLAAAGLAPEPNHQSFQQSSHQSFQQSSHQPFQQSSSSQLQEPLQPSQTSLPAQSTSQPFASEFPSTMQPMQPTQPTQVSLFLSYLIFND